MKSPHVFYKDSRSIKPILFYIIVILIIPGEIFFFHAFCYAFYIVYYLFSIIDRPYKSHVCANPVHSILFMCNTFLIKF